MATRSTPAADHRTPCRDAARRPHPGHRDHLPDPRGELAQQTVSVSHQLGIAPSAKGGAPSSLPMSAGGRSDKHHVDPPPPARIGPSGPVLRATASTPDHPERLQNVIQTPALQFQTIEQPLSHICPELGKLTESKARGIGAEQGSNAAAWL